MIVPYDEEVRVEPSDAVRVEDPRMALEILMSSLEYFRSLDPLSAVEPGEVNQAISSASLQIADALEIPASDLFRRWRIYGGAAAAFKEVAEVSWLLDWESVRGRTRGDILSVLESAVARKRVEAREWEVRNGPERA